MANRPVFLFTTADPLSLIRIMDKQHLLPALPGELRRLAAAKLAGEKPGHTLDATALVHEAYLKLGTAGYATEGEFFRAAAVAMQRILVDHARRKNAGKRRADAPSVSVCPPFGDPDNLIDLSEAIEKLAAEEPGLAELARMRLFVGAGLDEAAAILGLSRATAYRDWNYTKAWLIEALHTSR